MKLYQYLKDKSLSTSQGLLLTVLLSMIVLCFFFGKIIISLNTTYFAAGGDGFKAYYGAIYHIKYDVDYFRTTGMNYPHGEMVFFTDSQPLLANAIKLISDYIVDISMYTVGILNGLMLLSFVLSSIFIFLIFRELKLPSLYSCYLAVAITFLSPQVGRLTGHFSLSFIFVIPLLIWLLMRFYERPTFSKSFTIAIVTFLAASMHLYYIGFLAVLLLFFWGYKIGFEREGIRKTGIKFLHFSIQLILPYLALQLLINCNDTITDRTTHPWGILVYKSHYSSIFLPYYRGYGQWLHKISSFDYLNWEGQAYIGLVAVVVSICGIVAFVKRCIRRTKPAFHFTDQIQLNILLLASIAALLYSFGIPYIWGLEWILDYVGVLRQMRGIGRFTWLFFYLINIIAFYRLWNWNPNPKLVPFKPFIIACALIFVGYDAYLNIGDIPTVIYNKIDALENPQSKDNDWLTKINPDKYQAILPLPFFHAGSENIWYDGGCESLKQTLVSSLQTGLPSIAVTGSRISIRQTIDNLQTVFEPYRNLTFLSKCRSKKPFLLLVMKCDNLTESEKNLLKLVRVKLYESERFSWYELPYHRLKTISDLLYSETLNEMNSLHLYKHKNVYSTDSLQNFVYTDFYGNLSNNAYMGVDAFEGVMKKSNTFFKGQVPAVDTTKNYVISFWLGGIQRDLCSRTMLEVKLLNKGECYQSENISMFKLYQTFDKNWGLIEYKVKFKHPDDVLELNAQNTEMLNAKLYIDQVLIRPSTTNIFIKLPEYIGKNNRYFKIE